MKNVIIRVRNVIFFFGYLLSFIFFILIGYSTESFWTGFLGVTISWAVIDVLNLAVSYIFEGAIDYKRSIYYLMFKKENKDEEVQHQQQVIQNIKRDAIHKVIKDRCQYVAKIISEDKLIQLFEMAFDAENSIKTDEGILNKIYQQTGKKDMDFDRIEVFDEIDKEVLKTYLNAKNDLLINRSMNDYATQVTGYMIIVDHKLDKGLSLEKGYELIVKNEKQNYKLYKKRVTIDAFIVATNLSFLKILNEGNVVKSASINLEELTKMAVGYFKICTDKIKEIMINPPENDKIDLKLWSEILSKKKKEK